MNETMTPSLEALEAAFQIYKAVAAKLESEITVVKFARVIDAHMKPAAPPRTNLTNEN
jgi:hypothetical protein